MAKITVNNIPGLSEYGTAIKTFSKRYTSAINETARTFETKLEGNHAEAVSAFLGRLNQLQNTVFDQFPVVLSEYAAVISTYESSLTGVGFQTKAWTDDAGAQAVSTELTGNQVSEIDDVKSNLQKVLDQASEALEYSSFDLSPGVNRAESGLGDAANQRTQKNETIQTAYDVFIKGLESSLQDLTDLEGPMANAIYTIQIPVSTVTTAIQNGTLTKDEMYYFGVIQTQEDAQALYADISEEPGRIMKVNPNKISDKMYIVISNEINQWVGRGELSRLQSIITAMGENTLERNNVFTNKILIAEEVQVTMLMNRMYALYVTKPDVSDEEKFRIYELLLNDNQKQLDSINQATGLFTGLQYLGIGKKITTYFPPTDSKHPIYSYHKNSASIYMDEAGIISIDTKSERLTTLDGNLRAIDYNELQETKGKYTSNTQFNDLGASAGELNQSLEELQEQRVQARREFIDNLITGSVKTAISLLPYGSIAVASLDTMAAISSSDEAGAIENSQKTFEEFKDSYEEVYGKELLTKEGQAFWDKISELGSFTSDQLVNYNNYKDTLSYIEAIEDEKTLSFFHDLVDQGGWKLTPVEADSVGTKTSRSGYYDFNAFLRVSEFDNHGLTGLMSYSNIKDTELDRLIDLYDVSSQMAQYLKGESTDLMMSKFSPKDWESFNNVVGGFGNDSFGILESYLEEKYGMEDPYGKTRN